jgi:hypothetical protein
MLNAESIEQVCLAPGATDLRKSIDGLSALVSAVFEKTVDTHFILPGDWGGQLGKHRKSGHPFI